LWLGMQVRLSACPPVGPASDVVQFVVLPLAFAEEERSDLIGGTGGDGGGEAEKGRLGRAVRG